MSPIFKLGTTALAIQSLNTAQTIAPAPVHRILVADISGSMYSDLPRLREILKNKLTTMVQEDDTVTIVWYSGRGQFGTLIKRMPVASVSDLQVLHKAIDRFLQPLGMTGFKEPLQEVNALVDEMRRETPNYQIQMVFNTDGYENQWPEKDILELCRVLEPKLDSAVLVEYGWHCNRPLMSRMAEALGGELVFSENFPALEMSITAAMGGRSSKKVAVTLDYAPVGNLAFALFDGKLITLSVDDSYTVLVPEAVTDIGFFVAKSSDGIVFQPDRDTHPLLFAALVPLAQRGNVPEIFSVLAGLGDVSLIEQFTNCFSKEDYSRFQESVLAAAVDPAKRYSQGYDPKRVPKEDAFTVLDLLVLLAEDSECKFYPYHPSFEYARTSVGTESKDSVGARFEPSSKSKGYSIDELVVSEKRPNVSIRVVVPGIVTLPAEGKPDVLDATVPSFIYRNYTIVRDGIVHTRQIPVSMGQETFARLQGEGLLTGEVWESGRIYLLAYPKLPVMNRKMVRTITAKETFQRAMDIQAAKAANKVYKELLLRIEPKKSVQLAAQYGEAVAAWLASNGVTDGGFNPPVKTVPVGDEYPAKELAIAVKGLSSLPAVAEVEGLLAGSARLTKIGQFLMGQALRKYEDFKAVVANSGVTDLNAVIKPWLASQLAESLKISRGLSYLQAKDAFNIIVGQSWFNDLASRDDDVAMVDVPGFGSVQVKATLKETIIKI